MAGKEGR